MKLSSEHGRDLIDDWLKRLPIGVSARVRVELETTLRFFRFMRMELWARPQFSWLTGDKYRGIGEFRFKAANVAYRPLGCFGPEPDQFTLLLGAEKTRARKGHTKWKPPNAPDLAAARMKLLIAGRRDVHEYQL